MVSMNSWILSMKVLLISAGVVSLAVGLRFVVPVAVSEIPAIWSVILSWLKPPYLYIIINGIIITIAASSHFHQSKPEPAAARSEHLVSVETPPLPSFESFSAPTEISTILEETPPAAEVVVSEVEDAVVELRAVTVNGSPVDIGPEAEEEALIEADEEEEALIEADEDRDVFVDSTFMHNNFTQASAEDIISPEIQLESLFPRREKPLVTSRFGHRKPNRPNPEGGRGLRVARAKKHDTLESTWKMITEGRHVPLTRHLKKSETFEHEHAHVAPAAVPKSETFKDRGSKDAAAPPPRIGREPSPGQDELNRRVEAFIKKFNEEMRMQRQESLNQYMNMINRGV